MDRTGSQASEHQILFTPENVGLILRDLKIETRRLLNPQPPELRSNAQGVIMTNGLSRRVPMPAQLQLVVRDGKAFISDGDKYIVRCRYGKPGDTLWVKETWQLVREIGREVPSIEHPPETITWWEPYEGKVPKHDGGPLHPMPGWVIAFKADENQAFDELPWRPSLVMPRWVCRLRLKVERIWAEPLHAITEEGARAEGAKDINHYRAIWDRINAKKVPWSNNPWVIVVRFARLS